MSGPLPAGMELVCGAEQIRRHLDAAVRTAGREVRTLLPAPSRFGGLPGGRPGSLPPPGVEVRAVVTERVVRDARHGALVVGWPGRGLDLRAHPEPPMRLVLVDDEVGIVPVDPADPGRGCYVLRCPGLIGPLAALFEVVWQTARPLSSVEVSRGAGIGVPAGRVDPPSRAMRQALSMMREGATDEAIGRALGVTSRTVRRWMSEAMQQVRAGNRFELGVAAARHGWLATDGSAVTQGTASPARRPGAVR